MKKLLALALFGLAACTTVDTASEITDTSQVQPSFECTSECETDCMATCEVSGKSYCTAAYAAYAAECEAKQAECDAAKTECDEAAAACEAAKAECDASAEGPKVCPVTGNPIN